MLKNEHAVLVFARAENSNAVIAELKSTRAHVDCAHRMSDLDNLAKVVKRAFTLVEQVKESSDVSTHLPVEKQKSLELKAVQLDGIKWLAAMFEVGLNPILCDVMGLGKTRQLVAFMFYLHKKYPVFKKFLVICPVSIRAVWQTEIALVGLPPDMVVITNYHAMRAGNSESQTTVWDYVVFDEAHHLLIETQTRAIASNLISPRCALVTGTPFVNEIADVYPLLAFANPEIFTPNPRKDAASIIKAMGRFEHKLNPFILRRLRREKNKKVPRLIEHMHELSHITLEAKLSKVMDLLDTTIPPPHKTVIFSSRRNEPVRARARVRCDRVHSTDRRPRRERCAV